MRIVVAGGTGFIGRALCRRLADAGHAVTVLTRQPEAARARLYHAVAIAPWQGFRGPTEELTKTLGECDVVINLAGAPVADRRWTPLTKELLRQSREGTTSAIVSTLAKLKTRPVLLLNASAVGYYGPRGDEELTETASSGDGFLASLCREWEGAARAAERLGVRVVTPRIGMVLGKDGGAPASTPGGALAKMLPIYRLGLGGPLGRGTQWVSWIHLDDLVELLTFLMDHAASGPVNATAPHPVTNAEFSKTLGQVLGRPAFLPTPGFAMRVLFGEMADELLLTGQRVLPHQAHAMGFHFRFPFLSGALHDILR
jgi:uncharacterized protein (TIGR01777 family)